MKCLVNCVAVVSAVLLVISCSEAANLAQGKWKSVCPYVSCFTISKTSETHPLEKKWAMGGDDGIGGR